MIAAVSKNGVIGQDNKLPFDYSEDLKHFKRTTLDCAIVMGRKTFEGIGRALPKRENIVITKSELNVPNVKCMRSMLDVFRHFDYIGEPPIWLIGGTSIYEEGMKWANQILITVTPDVIEGEGLVRFPWINPLKFKIASSEPMSADERLTVVNYERVAW